MFWSIAGVTTYASWHLLRLSHAAPRSASHIFASALQSCSMIDSAAICETFWPASRWRSLPFGTPDRLHGVYPRRTQPSHAGAACQGDHGALGRRRTVGFGDKSPRSLRDTEHHENGALGSARWPPLRVAQRSCFHGYWRADHPSRRARREEFVEALLAAIPVLPVTLATARVVGRIDARLTAEGQRIPTSDLLIAATALSRGDAIVTGDTRHFDRVTGLTVHLLTGGRRH